MNGKGRPVDMSLQIAEALKAHQLESKKKGLALGSLRTKNGLTKIG